MSKIYRARIHWISENMGGRRTLPSGDSYAPIIILKGEIIDGNCDNWSINVKIKKIISSNETIADMIYLSKDAPKVLSTGKEFELYEGMRKVAYGIVL